MKFDSNEDWHNAKDNAKDDIMKALKGLNYNQAKEILNSCKVLIKLNTVIISYPYHTPEEQKLFKKR